MSGQAKANCCTGSLFQESKDLSNLCFQSMFVTSLTLYKELKYEGDSSGNVKKQVCYYLMRTTKEIYPKPLCKAYQDQLSIY